MDGLLGINFNFNSILVSRDYGRVNMSSVQWSTVKVMKQNHSNPRPVSLKSCPRGCFDVVLEQVSNGTGSEGPVSYMGN